jgi:predicted DsbA family dithiol-disulfide isomerase
MADEPLIVDYYTDVLCVWAYIAQIKVDQIKQEFGPRVAIRYHYLPLFGNNAVRIGSGWKDQGGFAGYGAHVCKIAEPCTYVTVHPEVWSRQAPATSLPAHLYIKAIEVLESSGGIDPQPRPDYQGRIPSQEFAWRVRQAFFRDLREVDRLHVLREIAEEQGLPAGQIALEIGAGQVFAALAQDMEDKERLRLEGSPTFVLNDGRQKLYGNLGGDVIIANIRALLERDPGQPIWR